MGMQIKTIMKHHLTPITLVIIKKTKIKCSKDVEKRQQSYIVGGNVNWSSRIMENSTEVTQNIKNRITVRISNSTSGYLHEENENTNSKIYLYPKLKHYLQ